MPEGLKTFSLLLVSFRKTYFTTLHNFQTQISLFWSFVIGDHKYPTPTSCSEDDVRNNYSRKCYMLYNLLNQGAKMFSVTKETSILHLKLCMLFFLIKYVI